MAPPTSSPLATCLMVMVLSRKRAGEMPAPCRLASRAYKKPHYKQFGICSLSLKLRVLICWPDPKDCPYYCLRLLARSEGLPLLLPAFVCLCVCVCVCLSSTLLAPKSFSRF